MSSDQSATNAPAGWKVRKPRETSEMPPRSELYCLAPLGVGTIEIESLTSYIQRMAWAYRVNPRVLIAEVILPHLGDRHYADPGHLGSFSRTRSMSINGIGEVAQDWAKVLERLTMRSDLRFLTLRPWADGLPVWGLQRQTPQWCPACYEEWREHQQPVYHPLLWTLQAVTICLRHSQPLVEHCPACQKLQSAIASKRQLGYCTQCQTWLGSEQKKEASFVEDHDLVDWQTWVVNAVEELSLASRAFGSLPWSELSRGMAACVESVGGGRAFGRLMKASKMVASSWLNKQRTPSFSYVLEMCYVLNVSPLQVMTVEPARLKERLLAEAMYRQPPCTKQCLPASKGDMLFIQQFLQKVLDGETGPLPVRHVAQHLGVGEKFLVGRFPQECSQITAHYLEDRAERAKKRVMLECAEIRQVVLTLDEQGIPLSRPQVVALLSNPNIIRRPEAKVTWQAICRERGLEP
jgi:hypothetical protein